MALRNVEIKEAYRSKTDDLVNNFYIPCLNASIRYDRAVGYFRSSIFSVVNEAIISFAIRRGKMRIICSPSLDADDIAAIQQSMDKRREVIEGSVLRDVTDLVELRGSTAGTQILSTLVAHHLLDIKIAIPKQSTGLFHDKLGIFSDERGEAVSFRGSNNETQQAWHQWGNYESFEVFCSWGSESDKSRVKRHVAEFELLWTDSIKEIEVIDFPKAARNKLLEVAEKSVKDLSYLHDTGKLQTRTPRKHQSDVLKSWRENGYRGLVAHATGSGKTFTAILAIREHVKQGGSAVILVPSSMLLRQWKAEVEKEIAGVSVLEVGDGNTKWRHGHLLAHFLTPNDGSQARVIVATMQSACDPLFVSMCASAKRLLVVADEVHQIGSAEYSSFLTVPAEKRLGLSATPERFGDPEGTQRIIKYFGKRLSPSFTLRDGIRSGTLCPYTYTPLAVSLTEEEARDWQKLTKEIRQLSAMQYRATDSEMVQQKLQRKIFARLRIAKKAYHKTDIVKDILEKHYKPGQRWLVYAEDKEHLNKIKESLRGFSDPLFSYYSGVEADSESDLRWFKHQGGVLLSIRCLDEGVDIPEISHAIILASSQNPRQYIQRRGRVLRPFRDKAYAEIFDVVVKVTEEDQGSTVISERPRQSSFQKAELARALTFAEDAMNAGAMHDVRMIALSCGVADLSTSKEEGTENGGAE